MERINVNLATESYHNKNRAYAIMAAAAVVVALLSVYNISLGLRYQNDAGQYAGKIRQLSKAQLASPGNSRMAEMDMSQITEDSLYINRLIAEDIFPWNRLLSVFERNVPSEIILNRLYPSESFDVVTLEGEAYKVDDVSQLNSNLEATGLFAKVEIAYIGFRARGTESAGEGNKAGIEFRIEGKLKMDLMLPDMQYKRIETASGQ